MIKPGDVYYSDYLSLDTILHAQHPQSRVHNVKADDEMLFIVIHQAYELWFKQILFEVDIVHGIFSQEAINDNAPDLYNAVHRLKRITTILDVLVHQIDIMETMTPLDFLDFRNLLRPASGFQSIQFKIIEALLGLRFEERHGQQYYISALRPEDVIKVKKAEARTPLLTLINQWLERLPLFGDEHDGGPFWQTYRSLYAAGLQPAEEGNLVHFDARFMNAETEPTRRFSNRAARHALFIMLYRDYPLLQTPYQLLNTLLDIDELLAMWRFRHLNMVQRIIGGRVGTGGSSGRDYLKAALDKHYIYKELAELTSFMMDRHTLPTVPDEAQAFLQFNRQ